MWGVLRCLLFRHSLTLDVAMRAVNKSTKALIFLFSPPPPAHPPTPAHSSLPRSHFPSPCVRLRYQTAKSGRSQRGRAHWMTSLLC